MKSIRRRRHKFISACLERTNWHTNWSCALFIGKVDIDGLNSKSRCILIRKEKRRQKKSYRNVQAFLEKIKEAEKEKAKY